MEGCLCLLYSISSFKPFLSPFLMKILHFRKKLFLFPLVILLVFFLTIFVGFSSNSLKYLIKNDKIACGSVLMKTAIFPRGGDQMHFDQPWKMPEAIIHPSMEDLMVTRRGQKFIIGDFNYSPGLGNLMFQFAALRVLAQRERAKLVLPSECMLRRAFQMDEMVELVESKNLQKFIAKNANLTIEFKDCCKFDALFDQPIFIGNDQQLAFVNGYFQSFRYFHPKYEELIRINFNFLPGIVERANLILETIRNKKGKMEKDPIFVSIHVRHGMDLTMHQRNIRYGHMVAPREYFQRAMQQFNGENVFFIISSDNRAWAKKNIILPKERPSDAIYYLNSGFREVDMALLTRCHHTIISTGTFSWWIGYLAMIKKGRNETGEGKRKTIYFGGWPRPGSILEKIVDKKDYFLPDWIQI